MVIHLLCLTAKALRLSLLPLALVWLPACSDDGGNQRGGQMVDEPSGASLEGTLFVTGGAFSEAFGTIVAISPSTGAAAVASTVRQASREEGRYTPGAEFLIGGSRLSPRVMYGINECQESGSTPDFRSRRSCIEMADPSGVAQRVVTLDTDIVKPPLMSPDGSMFVVEIEEVDDIFGPRLLRLYTTTGDLLDEARLTFETSGEIRYDWTPDGRVVYGLHRTEQGAFVAIASMGALNRRDEAYRVSTNPEARLGTLAVSPDGASIAYDLRIPDAVPHRAYVLDVATSESILVAETPADRLVGRPTWSPGGQHLMVLHGDEAALSNGVLNGGTPPYLMLVSWPNDTPTLDVDRGIGRPIRVQNPNSFADLTVPQDFSFNSSNDPRFHYWLYDSDIVWGE